MFKCKSEQDIISNLLLRCQWEFRFQREEARGRTWGSPTYSVRTSSILLVAPLSRVDKIIAGPHEGLPCR